MFKTYSYRIFLTPFLLVSVKSAANDDLDRFNDPTKTIH